MKIVIDTNVFISGIFWEGNFCSQIIQKWFDGKIELISSIEIIDELIKTLESFKIRLDKNLIDAWKDALLKNATIVNPQIKLNVILADEDDNKFIEAAISGKAEIVISQDKHLLNLKEYQSIKIVPPNEALKLIQ